MRVKNYKSKYKKKKKKKKNSTVTIEKNGNLKNEHVNIKSYKKKKKTLIQKSKTMSQCKQSSWSLWTILILLFLGWNLTWTSDSSGFIGFHHFPACPSGGLSVNLASDRVVSAEKHNRVRTGSSALLWCASCILGQGAECSRSSCRLRASTQGISRSPSPLPLHRWQRAEAY